jgi:SAM-dependent methyltransferase
MGMEVWGFDLSKKMVEKCKQKMKNRHLDPDRIFWGDIQDPITYAHVLKDGLFDGLMAMGVMPHVENDDAVLDNMASLVRPGGRVFIEFRNKLFSLFTLNRYTYEFLIGDLLKDVDDKMKQLVSQDLKSKLQMDQPSPRATFGDSNAPGYDAILSKFHIPFEVVEMFESHHFKKIKLLWYHYHPAMPYLEKKMPELFRKEAVRLEREPSNWRGMFLCSAFVVEAVKG